MKLRHNRPFVFSAFASLLIVGCNGQPSVVQHSAPSPESVFSKTEEGISYTFLNWDAGLRLLVADRCGDGGWRGFLVSEEPGQPFVRCGTLNNPSSPDYVSKWTIKTLDGIEGDFDINGKTYDLSKGMVFLLEPTDKDISVKQLDLDLANLEPEEEATSAFVADRLGAGRPETD